ncbi:MAG: AMP-dependent synthetase, partial [Rhodospirillaceae bacterium]|nr:AMP-dependent synthetase [Rhodospirillaceae bacterium]
LKTDASVAEETLKDWINANVAAKFQRVSRVLIMDDFPRNAAGKTLKRAIRDGLLP